MQELLLGVSDIGVGVFGLWVQGMFGGREFAVGVQVPNTQVHAFGKYYPQASWGALTVSVSEAALMCRLSALV